MGQEEFGPYQASGLSRSSLTDADVLKAMSRVPRHLFVPDSLQEHAYDDRALSIGEGQTISQPFIVALMTQEAKVRSGAKVLEIGTGSGYQAAVLAELGARVFSVEILPELESRAKKLLSELGYQSVNVRCADGWDGWLEEAPFDSVLVTASCPEIPDSLVSQLADGGRMVLPVERGEWEGEELLLVSMKGGRVKKQSLGPVKFVPLVGKVRAM